MWLKHSCAALGLLASSAIAVNAEDRRVVTFCGAANKDDHLGWATRREGSITEPKSPVDIIAVGSIRPAESGHGRELLVERVLFGPQVRAIPVSCAPELRFTDLRGEKQIYCLSIWPSPVVGRENTFAVSSNLRFHRIFSLEEEPALRAMARARLDLLVLGSDTIFVGQPLASRKIRVPCPNRHLRAITTLVLVESVVTGEQRLAGQKIEIRGSYDPFPTSDSYVYFVQEKKDTGVQFYEATRRWPACELPQVEASLKRAPLYPVRTFNDREFGLQVHREIFFTGSRDEAKALLASKCVAAQNLASRRLQMERERGHPAFK